MKTAYFGKGLDALANYTREILGQQEVREVMWVQILTGGGWVANWMSSGIDRKESQFTGEFGDGDKAWRNMNMFLTAKILKLPEVSPGNLKSFIKFKSAFGDLEKLSCSIDVSVSLSWCSPLY